MNESKTLGFIGAVWGVAGICLLLACAVIRLGRLALEAFAGDVAWYHWVVLAVLLPFMAWSEGAEGFQKSFSPRVAARARHLRGHPHPLHVLLAPLFCMGFFHVSPRRGVIVWLMTAAIVALVVFVRQAPQPWRGIIDAGVVAGLAWGLATVLVFGYRALTAETFDYSAELPERVTAAATLRSQSRNTCVRERRSRS